jgi:hypothetical protein
VETFPKTLGAVDRAATVTNWLGRTVATHHRRPASYQIRYRIRYRCFRSDNATEP